MAVPKPGKKYKAKRPTRDEYQLEELGERLVEAKEEETEVQLTVWGEDQLLRGTITGLDSRTRLVSVTYRGEITKVPFLDIMKVESPK